MKLNGIERIHNDGGDYVLLVDYGTEGLSVWKQYQTLGEAVDAMSKGCHNSCAVLKLIEVIPVEQSRE